jgi:hypothetical protein
MNQRKLALKCATDVDVDVSKVERFSNEFNFEEPTDDYVFKLLPAFSLNIPGNVSLEKREKFVGVYRSFSFQNARRLHAALDAFSQLNSLNVNYRVLKGYAIGLTTGYLGYRSMGDIDILIKQSEFQKVKGILINLGFVSSLGQVENQRESKLTFRRDTCEIDLHIAEKAFPSLIFRKMMKEPAVGIIFAGEKIEVPKVSRLIQHSIIHAMQNVGILDRPHSLIDLAVLNKIVDSTHIQKLRMTLSKKNDDSLELDQMSIARFAPKLIFVVMYLSNTLIQLSSIKNRTKSGLVVNSKLNILIHPNLFRLWYYFGRKAIVEKFLCKRSGFLNLPHMYVEELQSSFEVRRMESRLTPHLTVMVQPSEIRMRLRFQEQKRNRELKVISKSLDLCNFEVFANGKLIGNIGGRDKLEESVTIWSNPESVEISFREASGREISTVLLPDEVSSLEIEIVN